MKKFIYIFCISFIIASLIGCGKEDIKQNVGNAKNDSGRLTKRVRTGKNYVNDQFSKMELFPDIQKIITRGTLNIGIYEDSDPPFIIRDSEGKIIGGLDIEITDSLAKHLGVEAVFDSNIKNHTELLKKLNAGEIDIAVGELSHTFDGSKYIYFSNTYVRLHQSLILNKKEIIRLNIRDNPYKYICENTCNIGVHADSSYVEFAQNLFPKANVYEYDSLQEALEALNKHEIFAILDDDNEIMLLARNHPEIVLSFTVYELKYQNDNISIAISPKSPNLCDCINLYLENHDYYFDVDSLMDKYPEAYNCE